MKLIYERPANNVFGKRECWEIGSDTVIVAYGKENCGISISDETQQDITERVARYLNVSEYSSIKLISTIDAPMIECNKSELVDLLSRIEQILVD